MGTAQFGGQVGSDAMIDFSKHEGLVSLHGFPFPVRVSTGSEDAAGRMAARCARAFHFMSYTFDFEPRVALLVLTRLDWAKRATLPAYGLPHTRVGNLIVPGDPSDFFHGLVELLRAGPPWVWDEACRIYGVSDGVPDLSVFLELIAVHGAGSFSGSTGSSRG